MFSAILKMCFFTSLFFSNCLFFLNQAFAHPPKAFLEMEPGFFSGYPVLFVNGKEIRSNFLSFGGYDISEEMKDNSLALEFALEHESKAMWSGIVFWGGLGAAISYLSITPRDTFRIDNYYGILLIGVLPAAIFQRSAQGYLHKAINAYNGVYTTKSAKFELSVNPLKGGATLGFNLAF